MSAGSVLDAIDPDQFEIVPIGVTPEGRWVLASGDPARLSIQARSLPSVKDGAPVVLSGDPTTRDLIVVEPGRAVRELSSVDVVFPVLHGPYGEDGTIQGLLEMADLPYVGAGVLASAVSMDKEYTKKLLAAAGLPIGPYEVLRRGEQLTAEQQERLGLPVFVKPARGGSSIGVSKVDDWSDLAAALAAARETDPKVLVEAAISGQEIECGVLEGEDFGPPVASLPAEIHVVRGHGWYDFEAKYLDDACDFDIPAKLAPDVTERIRALACAAFSALDGAGLARVDFFVTPDEQVFINEINTMPGFTPISLFPRMWEAAGVPYRELVTRLIRTAIARGTGLR